MGSILMVLILLTSLLVWSKSIHTSVNMNDLRTSLVKYGDFQEIIVANGTIEPASSVLIDVSEGGTISSIHAEDGQFVNAGEVLLGLSNESSTLDYMQRETQMVEQINNLRNTRIALAQNQRSNEDQLAEVQYQLILAEETFEANQILFKDSAISYREYFDSKQRIEHLKAQSLTLSKRLSDDKAYANAQVGRIDQSLVLMERNLEHIRKKLHKLEIVAPMSGQLNSFTHELGQVLNRNESAGRIDKMDEFILKANVDQHYINRISTGQAAYIESSGRRYTMSVSKVQPTIVNGQFEINLEFNDTIPSDLRRGQIFQLFIEISARKKALMLEKGSFYGSSAGKYVYVIRNDNTQAKKRQIQLGAQNDQYYEIISGLEEGETVIISSYKTYNKEDKLDIIEE
ncbi:HlyD family efflux transporter periplasmic adaptor subunit [bacterium]|nr:HlyD family efflux transporter periplasmic adaptor subunit [bacterium]